MTWRDILDIETPDNSAKSAKNHENDPFCHFSHFSHKDQELKNEPVKLKADAPVLDHLTETERQAYQGWYDVMVGDKFNMSPKEAHVEALRRIEFSKRALRGEFGNEQETYFESVRLFGGEVQ